MTAILVLGLGNPLLGDDGTGLCLLELLRAAGPWPDDVEFVDGGTWGLSLLPALTDADRVLILDAVRTGAAPGTVRCALDNAVPRLYERPASAHQLDLGEVLAAAALLGRLPARLAVVGIEPQRIVQLRPGELRPGELRPGELRIGLSPPVTAALGRATDEAGRLLSSWGAGPLAT